MSGYAVKNDNTAAWAVSGESDVPDGCYYSKDIPAEVGRAPDILRQIAELEATVTPRRSREAVLSGDYSFIQSVDDQIAVLRESL